MASRINNNRFEAVDQESTVRFRSDVLHIPHTHLHEEEFPIRPMRPVKGRRPTMYSAAKEINSDEDLASEASDASDYAKLRSIVEGSSENGNRLKKKSSKGVGSKLSDAMKIGSTKKEDTTPVKKTATSTEALVNIGTRLQEATGPVFADGLSLSQHKSRDKIESQKEGAAGKKKHAFARLVEVFKSANSKTKDNHFKGENNLAPWVRIRLLELATMARLRALEVEESKALGYQIIRDARRETPSWSCGNVDHAALLHDEEPLTSLVRDFSSKSSKITKKTSQKDSIEPDKHQSELTRSVKVDNVRSKLAENRFRFVDDNDEVIWIGRDGQVIEQPVVIKCNGHHHSSQREVALEACPHGKIRTVRTENEHNHHHHHHHHHRNEELKSHHHHFLEGQKERPKRSNITRRPHFSIEEKALMEENYKKVVKKEAESQFIHDAISLGGSTW